MSEEAGLKIKISADVRQALLSIADFTDATHELAVEGVGNIQSINSALEELRKAQKDVADPKDLGTVNRAIKDLGKESERLKNIGVKGFDELGNKIKDVAPAAESAGKGIVGAANGAYGAIKKIANILPGLGIAGVFGFIGSALLAAAETLGIFNGELFKTSDATKRAAEDAKHLADVLVKLKSASEITLSSTGGEEGNIDRVRALAAVIQDTNKSYKERKNALDELRETNKAYFGDLTLEAASLKTLQGRINEYSQALISEAIVKGQVEAISKISAELANQERQLAKLKTEAEQAAKAQKELKITPTGGGIGTVGGTNISQEAQAQHAVDRTSKAYDAQRDAVFKLREAIATYRGELNNAIAEQVKFKPLKDAPEQKETLKSIVPILEQIKRVYDEINRPDREPIFKRFAESVDPNNAKLISAQIKEAVKKGAVEGAKDPEIRQAYEDLAKALGEKLQHIQNPNLRARIQPLADIDEKELEQFAKDSGKTLDERMKRLPPLKSRVGVELEFDDFTKYQQEYKKDLDGLQDQLTKILRDFTRQAQEKLAVNLGKALGDALSGNGLQDALSSFANFLGSALQDIGERLIVASALFQAINVSLSSLFSNPGLALAAGVAAIALGQVIKNSFKPHAFATGGIVTGPTLGLVGEAGPEVIFPLNQLNRFIKGTRGGGSTDVNVRGVISGNNLRLVMARSVKNQALV